MSMLFRNINHLFNFQTNSNICYNVRSVSAHLYDINISHSCILSIQSFKVK